MPGWSELRRAWPASVTGPAQTLVLDAVREGHVVPIDWRQVVARDDEGNELRMAAAGDALKLGTPGDSVRPNVSHRTAQQIADWHGWVLPTPLMSDLATQQAAQFIGANALTASALWRLPGTTTQTKHMEEHSRAIDARSGGAEFIAGPWKEWHSSTRLALPPSSLPHGKRTGLQYGFYDPRARYKSVTGLGLWQPEGATHHVDFVDYSEKMRPWARVAWFKPAGADAGVVVDLADIAADPKLSKLVSTKGPVSLHHPWLPVCKTLAEGGGCSAPPPGGAKPPPAPPPSKPPAPRPDAALAKVDLVPLLLVGVGALGWYLVKS